MILSVTGHRPDKITIDGRNAYDPEVYVRLVAFATKMIEEEIRHLEEVILGMAQGWDQAIAEACIATGTLFVAAIPFIGQESKWPEAAQRRYHEILSRAILTKTICEGGYTAWKMQKRNEYMVNNSTKLLALWDGSPGGTANCLKYARGVTDYPVPIRNVWAEWQDFIR